MSFIKCIQQYYMENEKNLKVLVGRGCVQYAREMKKVYTNLYLLTYSMVQVLSWEANWFAASQEIPRIL